MAKEKDYTEQVIALIERGNYDIVQQINGREEEKYECCTENLYRVLESGEARVQLLPSDDPRARKNTNTFTIDIEGLFGDVTITIWEL